jgi:hypothetical protein
VGTGGSGLNDVAGSSFGGFEMSHKQLSRFMKLRNRSGSFELVEHVAPDRRFAVSHIEKYEVRSMKAPDKRSPEMPWEV